MSKRFEKNCTYFEHKNPRGAALLSFADSGSVSIGETALGELNLVLQGSDGKEFFHSPQGALKEAEEWVSTLVLKDIEVLVIYGVGIGHGYVALKKWLEEDRRRQLIFLEDDQRVLLQLFETLLATELLLDPQAHLYFIEDSPEGLQILQSIAWSTFGKKMEVTCLPYYASKKKKVFEAVKSCLLYQTSDLHSTLDEYVAFGIPFFRNFWRNLFLMPGSYQANKLEGAFRGCPAIIVAAGPSLAKHLDDLKEIRDRALIFSGGSSVNALIDASVMPHFGAGIDPNPLQYLRIRQGLAMQVPFFFRHRLFHEAAALISGPRLYLRGGDGYNTSDWFEKRLHVGGKIIGGGHSISNFCIEIAQFLGCSPLILVGFDLSYGKDLQLYAPGVHDSGVENGALQGYDEPVVWTNKQGEVLYTAWKWLVEAKWIEDFKKSHPRLHIINATEGGLGLQGIEDMSFAAVKEELLTQSFDSDGLVHTALREVGIYSFGCEEVLKSLSLMYDSLSQSIKYLETLALFITKNKRKKNPLSCLETPEFILTDTKLKKEIAFRYIIEVFDRMKIKLEFYQRQFASHPNQKQRVRDELEMDLLEARFFFLKQVAMCNQAFIVHAVRQQQEQGRDIHAFCPKSQVNWG